MVLALFFTRDVSLAQWDNLGMFEREIKIYQDLSKHFKNIYIYTYGLDSRYQCYFSENIKIISKPRYIPSLLYSLLMPLIHHRTFKKVDILKTNQMDGSWSAVIAKKIFKKKLVVRCGYEWLNFIEISKKSHWKRLFAKIVEGFAYQNADVIIQTSQGAIDFISKRFKIDSKKVFLIPNYVNTDFFIPKDIKKDQRRVIAVGRLEPQKNLFNLIEAMLGLSVHLILIGDGAQKEDLENFAKKMGVSVKFAGKLPQSDIIKELSRSEVYILPSIYEGHPKALLEAMSCGLACIGSNVPGINDTLTNGLDGIICGTDVKSIHRAVGLLIKDPEKVEYLGNNARKTILEKFSLENIIEKELKIYESL